MVTTKQKTFDFYLDQTVTTWYRTEFEIKADSEEEAKQKAIEFIKRGDHIDICWDHLDDTIELMSVGDNGGEATAELYDTDGNMISDNISSTLD